ANGCDSTVILNLTINSVGIDDQVANAANISLYPNPTRNYVELVIDENVDIKEAQIFDIYGKLLKIEKIVNKHSRISFETYANGIYLLRLNNGTEVVKTFKVIKN
ncbi:MAG TPA: T9SS type A sorting domain-containing protein, partial [Bacteroidales bacterium]|nr:T9SS type A sorting domain-containing protein [Bacteroidales bacterium]